MNLTLLIVNPSSSVAGHPRDKANSERNFINNELHCAKIRVLTTVAKIMNLTLLIVNPSSLIVKWGSLIVAVCKNEPN